MAETKGFKRMRRADPVRLLETGQVESFKSLKAMLIRHGFEQNGGANGSHFLFQHRDFKDLSVGLVRGTDQIIYQQNAAKACMQVVERQKELQASNQTPLAAAFSDGAQTSSFSIKDHLPEDVELCETTLDEDCVIVRSREYPQVGALVRKKCTQADLERHVGDVQARSAAFSKALAAALDTYEMTCTRDKDGTLVLVQPHYEFEERINVYSEEHFGDPLWDLNELTEGIKELDEYVFYCVHAYYRPLKESGTAVVTDMPDGSSKWNIKTHTPFPSKNGKVLTLIMSPGGRYSQRECIKIMDEMFRHFMCMDGGDTNALKKNFKNYGGFETKMSQDKRSLIMTHPFYPDYKKEMPVPWNIENPCGIIDMNLDNEMKEKIMAEALENQEKCRQCLIEMVHDFNGYMSDVYDVYAAVDEKAKEAGVQKVFMSRGKQGEVSTFFYQHPSFPKDVCFKYIPIINRQGERIALIDPESLKALEKNLALLPALQTKKESQPLWWRALEMF